jgi:hypothetical protein
LGNTKTRGSLHILAVACSRDRRHVDTRERTAICILALQALQQKGTAREQATVDGVMSLQA